MSNFSRQLPTPPLNVNHYRSSESASRGFRQVFTHEFVGDESSLETKPIALLVHGWPETRRIWWRCIKPLAEAGFEVIAPDLRGFGDSDLGSDGFHDVPAHSHDLLALLEERQAVTGPRPVVLIGGDLGGPIIQDMSMRAPLAINRMVLFNSPLPYDKTAMANMATRPPIEVADYFIRQGIDPDGLLNDLPTESARRAYIATFYTSRLWAHPGAFSPEQVDYFTEPFIRANYLRSSFGGYESAFNPLARSGETTMAMPNPTKTMVLFGPSDHVIYPDFDRMAEAVFPNLVGPFLLRDCGHFVQWEASRPLVSAIVSFCGISSSGPLTKRLLPIP